MNGLTNTYKPLEVIGPEHEFSIVNDELAAMPISDIIIKNYCGKFANLVKLGDVSFSKEMQLHVLEIKANAPFYSPKVFEERIQNGVNLLSDFLESKHNAHLLGTGMHPFLKLEETGIWSHRHKKIYSEYGRIFNLKQHGWLNIQSFHINLSYQKEPTGILIHNLLANVCPYLPAVSASSPICNGVLGEKVDNRLVFYQKNQCEVPSVSGDIIPEYVSSFREYKKKVIDIYSRDLKGVGAATTILYKEWVNSRGVIFRFDRSALEIRVIDEQECIKSDVALSCYIRAVLRGMLTDKTQLLPHELLVNDYNSVVAHGLDAHVLHPKGPCARDVCRHLYNLAWTNAEKEEKNYLPLIKERIENGNLSDLIKKNVLKKAQRTDFIEAIRSIYSTLIKCLVANQPYS